MNDLSVFSLAVILFLIMDPIGNISSYLTLMQGVDKKRRTFLLFREMGIALVTLIIFNYIGEFIFKLLGISKTTVLIASGVILFLIAIKILFPSKDSLRANLPKGEPFIVPLAIPLIAGPSLIATVMLYADLEKSQITMLGAIFIAWAASLCVFLMSPTLSKYLKTN